jgi:hypothetical protein
MFHSFEAAAGPNIKKPAAVLPQVFCLLFMTIFLPYLAKP